VSENSGSGQRIHLQALRTHAIFLQNSSRCNHWLANEGGRWPACASFGRIMSGDDKACYGWTASRARPVSEAGSEITRSWLPRKKPQANLPRAFWGGHYLRSTSGSKLDPSSGSISSALVDQTAWRRRRNRHPLTASRINVLGSGTRLLPLLMRTVWPAGIRKSH
jgi:hypothetical protein